MLRAPWNPDRVEPPLTQLPRRGAADRAICHTPISDTRLLDRTTAFALSVPPTDAKSARRHRRAHEE